MLFCLIAFYPALPLRTKYGPPLEMPDGTVRGCIRPCQDPVKSPRLGRLGKDQELKVRTISPNKRTFSPRTRNIPLGMSAYRSRTKIRSMVACNTRLPVDRIVSD